MTEDQFAFRVRQALNEGAERLDYKTVLRLEKARTAALARQRHAGPVTVRLPALQAATAGGPAAETSSGRRWLFGAAWVTPMLALTIGFVAISHWQKEREISRLAALDFAVLLDDGPLETYADRGFGVMLQAERPTRR